MRVLVSSWQSIKKRAPEKRNQWREDISEKWKGLTNENDGEPDLDTETNFNTWLNSLSDKQRSEFGTVSEGSSYRVLEYRYVSHA